MHKHAQLLWSLSDTTEKTKAGNRMSETCWSLTALNKVGQSAGVCVKRGDEKTHTKGIRDIQRMMDLVLSRSTGTLMMSTVFGVSNFQDLLRENLRERARERHDESTAAWGSWLQNWAVRAARTKLLHFCILQQLQQNANNSFRWESPKPKSNLLILFLIIHVSKNSASQDYRHMIGERANVTLTVLGKNMLNYYIKMFSLKWWSIQSSDI